MVDHSLTHDSYGISFGGYYHIEWSRMDAPNKVSFWLNHLGAKRWFRESDLEDQFLTIIEKHFKNMRGVNFKSFDPDCNA